MLCDTCKGVLQYRHNVIRGSLDEEHKEHEKPYKFIECVHHLTYASLARSAADECRICQIVWNELSEFRQDELRVESAGSCETEDSSLKEDDLPPVYITTAVLRKDWDDKNIIFRVYSKLRFDGVVHYVCSYSEAFEKDMDDTSSYSGHPNGPVTSDCTSSDESLQKARRWLQDCSTNHVKCNVDGHCSWYPTRLLYSGDSDNDGTYVRLVNTKKELPTGPYATLSHRWGGTKPLKLTPSIACHVRPTFPITEMPRTFQDAVQVCKKLEVKYLWIDSLCIIQDEDDRSDWQREAGLMDQVYLHSYCNISADEGDSTRGLFRSRLPSYVNRTSVQVNQKGFDLGTEFSKCWITDSDLWSRNISKSPLNQRGWVFQERLLAPRVLHFCRDQLFWECREFAACESHATGFSPLQLKYMKNIGKSWNPNEELGTTWSTFWDDIVVRGYSQTDLTFPGDKLIALSGIAKYIMPLVNAKYVAGMWQEHLEKTLLWRVYGLIPSSRPVEYRAPSWSWASIDGKTATTKCEDGEILVEVEDVVLQHATEDTTGAVTGGWLDLRGSLKPMKLCGEGLDHGSWFIVIGHHIVEKQYESIPESSRVRPFKLHFDVAPDDVFAFDRDNAEKRLFYVPYLDEEDCTKYLLLRLVDVDKKTFERFGIAVCYGSQRQEELLMADLDEETKASLPCLRYENGLHTIRII